MKKLCKIRHTYPTYIAGFNTSLVGFKEDFREDCDFPNPVFDLTKMLNSDNDLKKQISKTVDS